jgi:hypothetical protein
MRPALLLVMVALLLTACDYSTDASMLPEAEAARLAVIMTATAEAQHNQAIEAQAHATATAESFLIESARIYATATAEALAREAQYHAEMATATAEAMAREERYRAEMATATAVAFQPTATAIAQAITLREMEIERARRQAEAEAAREKMLLPIVTYGPWVLLAILAGVLVYALLRAIAMAELRARTIHRDPRGDAPLLVLPHGRGVLVYDGDKAFGPAMIADNSQVTMPRLVDDAQQATVTMRDQAVDLATRGLPRAEAQTGMSSRQRSAAKQLGLAGAPAQVRVIDANSVRGWLKDVSPRALELAMQGVDDE